MKINYNPIAPIMNNVKNYITIVCIIICLGLFQTKVGYSQEYLRNNNKIHFKNSKIKNKLHRKVGLSLPFFDDFSDVSSSTPNPLKWINNGAYINDDFAKNQPTIGVVTLDAIDNNGNLHNVPDTANYSTGDTLTSQLINGNGLLIADSLWVSFFVQSGGLGNTPEENDSLVFQMRKKNNLTSNWVTLWSKKGSQMDSFTPVRIPILDQNFINDSIQFRFINFFSLEFAGMNADHWNIDYVKLDQKRTYNDKLIDEIAYLHKFGNILNKYSSVPWQHFKEFYSLIINNITYDFRNYSDQVMNVTPYFEWTNLYTGANNKIGNIANNYYPETTYNIIKPLNGSVFTLNNSDSAKFLLETKFYISQTDYEANNKTSRILDFYNYYAYDDGSAEGMYGVSNKYGMIAVKFEPYKPDSLIGLRIYFNKSTNQEDRYFNLMVWDDSGSKPGAELYKKTRNLPSYADSINGFVTYKFDSSIYVSGPFYVGWQKITDQRLDMGFDKNYVVYQKNYYNANAEWKLSEYKGSLLIRPIFNKMYRFKDTFMPPLKPTETKDKYKVYPNPTSGILHVETNVNNWNLEIFNHTGQIVKQYNSTQEINIKELQTGIYFIRICDGNTYNTYKVIKL